MDLRIASTSRVAAEAPNGWAVCAVFDGGWRFRDTTWSRSSMMPGGAGRVPASRGRSLYRRSDGTVHEESRRGICSEPSQGQLIVVDHRDPRVVRWCRVPRLRRRNTSMRRAAAEKRSSVSLSSRPRSNEQLHPISRCGHHNALRRGRTRSRGHARCLSALPRGRVAPRPDTRPIDNVGHVLSVLFCRFRSGALHRSRGTRRARWRFSH